MNSPTETKAALAPPGTDVSISLRKLVLIRWVAVIGQAATLIVVHYGLGFYLPIRSAFAVVAASAVLNAAASLPRSARREVGRSRGGALSRL